MPVIVGLGNPGTKYEATRHNVGFDIVDKLAASLSVTLQSGKGSFVTGKAKRPHHHIRLARPTTYMNESGTAVRHILQWFKIDPKECLVCYDDLNLDTGSIRLRRGGSAGGHNGIKDIIKKISTDQFPRLRIGIGNDFHDGHQIQYVLSPFSNKEREVIDIAIAKAADAAVAFSEEGIETAMNDFN